MRIVHLADPGSPGGGACALAELSGVIKHTRGAQHTVILVGSRAHEILARRCGLPVHLRVPLPRHLPLLARKTLADRAGPLIGRSAVVMAWTVRSAALAASAWPGAHVLARVSVAPVGWAGFDRFLLAPALRSVSLLPSTHALAASCAGAGFDPQRTAVIAPAADLLTPGIAARADIRNFWHEEFAMHPDTFVVGLLGEPVSWPDARMAVEIVARLALAGRRVRMLLHPAASRRIEALTLLKRLRMLDLAMECDELAEPWRVIGGLDAALVLGVDFRAIGNAIRSAVRPGMAVHATPRRPSPSVSPIVWCFAAGVPVVAHDLPSNREVIEHDVTGLLVPEHDMNGASDGLARLYDHWPLRQRHSAAATIVARDRFAMPLLAERLMQACEDAQGGRLIGRVEPMIGE